MGLSYAEFASLAEKGMPADLLVKDVAQESAGTPIGDLVVANFGKVTPSTEKADACASIVTAMAVAAVRDVLLLDMVPYPKMKDVVFIGSSIDSLPSLRRNIERYLPLTGKMGHFPHNGQYSLAIGAYLAGRD
ncbi:MAG: hypothetical protein A3D92_14700 [Bacteroidetes bacterium RIFCSPHIGHO2_02_FULL_44_7]|nr:MAG: hypothetical protein A3D92_14700 [Bacteroidetes bacterium RIFCSPHIGHO2_02_FULL_44_7]